MKGRYAQEEKNSTNNTSGENNSNRNIVRDVERKEDDNTNTSSYNSDDGGREEETNDEWEKIRLYKERLVAKMAAYQQTLEKKRSQHGPNWLDGSPNVNHRKNRGQNRRTSLAVPRKINLHSSNDNKEKKEKKDKKDKKEQMMEQNNQRETKNMGIEDHLQNASSRTENNHIKQDVQPPAPQTINDNNNYINKKQNHQNNSNNQTSSKETALPSSTDSDMVAYELDKQLESIEYIAEVFNHSMNDEEDRSTSIVLRINGGKISEIDMNTGKTIEKRHLSNLIAVHTARGTFGDTVLRVEFRTVNKGVDEEEEGEEQQQQQQSVHVLYVLRQAGTSMEHNLRKVFENLVKYCCHLYIIVVVIIVTVIIF